MSAPSLTLGIEEEYLLVDADSGDLITNPPPTLLDECRELCGEQVSAEFLRSQIEIGTKVCKNVAEARENLVFLRKNIAEVASRHGLAPIAASTHPIANWREQKHTPDERYDQLAEDLQGVVRRMVIGGMHIHIGIEDEDLRIDLMNQFTYFLPHLMALSCSSPFWAGQNTGLKSYRLTVVHDLPRANLPERFSSWADYQKHVQILIDAGLLEDATKIWWDMRPSARYPTLEMRITDICTRVDDAITIAAITQSLMRMLYRLRRDNIRWREYALMLVNENRWRAMRYSFDEGLVDFGKSAIVSCKDLYEEVIDFVREDAEYLGCLDEVCAVRDILERGTSAHRQVAVYEEAIASGMGKKEALREVVRFLMRETVAGL